MTTVSLWNQLDATHEFCAEYWSEFDAMHGISSVWCTVTMECLAVAVTFTEARCGLIRHEHCTQVRVRILCQWTIFAKSLTIFGV